MKIITQMCLGCKNPLSCLYRYVNMSEPMIVLWGKIKQRKYYFIVAFILLLLFALMVRNYLANVPQKIVIDDPDRVFHYHGNGLPKNYLWPEYNTPTGNHMWFKQHCWHGKEREKVSITTLSSVIDRWSDSSDENCRSMYNKLISIYDVTTLNTEVVIKGKFEEKVRGWLGDNEQLFKEAHNQTIIKIFNQYTHENVLINPLRDKRPIKKPDKPERELIEDWVTSSRGTCDFCRYNDFTAEDKFPRIENKHSVSAANTFKWDKWHGLILTRSHHPLNWNEEQFLDLMSTALQWFQQVHSIDPEYKYPVIIWDLLPHASASQIHPHIHTNLNSKHYYGYIENWRSAGQRYFEMTSTNYLSDMVAVHDALGLTTRLGNAIAMAHLVPRKDDEVPRKDDEVVIISDNPDNDFFRLLYYTLRAYIDDMEKLCFSLSISLPTMGSDVDRKMPALARVVTRGSVSSLRSDISSVDLFVASNVNIDPYKVIAYVEQSVSKRSGKSVNSNPS